MSETTKILEMLHLEVPPYKVYACEYLEAAGQRFCVDFGIDNAIEKARAHWRARKVGAAPPRPRRVGAS